MKNRKIGFVLAFVCAMGAVYYFQFRPRSNWFGELDKSPTLTIYSLEPFPEKAPQTAKRLGKYAILGQMQTGEPDKTGILFALRRAQTGIETSASCFYPRLAVESQDKKTRLLLCFECGNVGGFSSGQKLWFGLQRLAKDDPETALNELLTHNKIPLSQSQIAKQRAPKKRSLSGTN